MAKRTSLSTGLVIRKLLSENAEVQNITRLVFPVIVDEAQLPYVVYRRADLNVDPNSHGTADTLTFEVACFAASYAESVKLAEAVWGALDGVRDDLLRSCRISSAEEMFEGDAFVQLLSFTVRPH